MTDRLTSTGRTPALAPADVARMLSRYFDEDKPSMATLAEEFPRTNKEGKQVAMSLATVRKYLKAAGIKLPRGRANDLPRKPQKVSTMMNRIPTETLIGKGRAQLLVRRIGRGEKVTALAREFGVSKDRVRRLRDRAAATPEVVAPEAEVIEAAPAVVVEALAVEAEAAPETPQEAEEAKQEAEEEAAVS